MSKVMFSLPDTLINRMRAVIPEGERSRVLANLLEHEIELREQRFYEQALQLEANQDLQADMKTWDQSLGEDGLKDV